MSDDKRRKEYFVKIANQFVKKEIRKRRVLQMTFSDAEMKEVEELKEFLVNIVTDNTDPMLLAYEGYTRYIGISFKVTLSNGLSTFVNVFYDVKDLDYAKDKLYVAKGIYKLSQNKHIETFFCTSLLRIKGKSRFGFYAPERRRENASSVSSIYIDLDLPSHLKGLDKINSIACLVRLTLLSFKFKHSSLL